MSHRLVLSSWGTCCSRGVELAGVGFVPAGRTVAAPSPLSLKVTSTGLAYRGVARGCVSVNCLRTWCCSGMLRAQPTSLHPLSFIHGNVDVYCFPLLQTILVSSSSPHSILRSLYSWAGISGTPSRLPHLYCSCKSPPAHVSYSRIAAKV